MLQWNGRSLKVKLPNWLSQSYLSTLAERVKVEFRKSFEKDLGKIQDEELLVRIKAVLKKLKMLKAF